MKETPQTQSWINTTIYNTQGAANFCNLSVKSIQSYVAKGRLRVYRLFDWPRKKGCGSLVFLEKDLIEFQRSRRPRGRPPS